MRELFAPLLEKAASQPRDDYAVHFLQELFEACVEMEITDLHFVPRRDELIVKVRKDGELYPVAFPKKDREELIMGRLKVLAHLPQYERNQVQDGRIRFEYQEKAIDLRVAFLPTLHGEKAAVRFPQKKQLLTVDELGLFAVEKNTLKRWAQTKEGMVIFSGPSSSGKTTSMYAILQHLYQYHGERLNIFTLEDPVEYDMPSLNQCQVKEDKGFSYYEGLKSILRQDPDVIMLGEIRDASTAYAAFQAALSGHFLLATFHGQSPAAVLFRLMNLGIDPLMIASVLKGIVHQRLLRKPCPHCRQQEKVPLEWGMARSINIQYTAQGCKKCYYTGIASRLAVFQVVPLEEELKTMFLRKTDYSQLQKHVQEKYLAGWNQKLLNLVEKGEIFLNDALLLLIDITSQ